MMNETPITRVTADEARVRVEADQDQTDWSRVREISRAELDLAIAEDPDEGEIHLDLDWTKALAEGPERKQMVNLRLDADILRWFRGRGRGYQTRINSVLKAYVRAQGGR